MRLRTRLAIAVDGLINRIWPPPEYLLLDDEGPLVAYEEQHEVIEPAVMEAADGPAGARDGACPNTLRRAALRQEIVEILLDFQPLLSRGEVWCAVHHTVYSACWVDHAADELVTVVESQVR